METPPEDSGPLLPAHPLRNPTVFLKISGWEMQPTFYRPPSWSSSDGETRFEVDSGTWRRYLMARENLRRLEVELLAGKIPGEQ